MTHRPPRVLAFAAFVGFALGATPAFADIISEEQEQCREQAEGDRCRVDHRAGHCAKSTCSQNDYSQGIPPKQVQAECLVCEPGRSTNTEVPTTQGCGHARIGEPSLAIGSSVIGLLLFGLARRRRATRRDP